MALNREQKRRVKNGDDVTDASDDVVGDDTITDELVDDVSDTDDIGEIDTDDTDEAGDTEADEDVAVTAGAKAAGGNGSGGSGGSRGSRRSRGADGDDGGSGGGRKGSGSTKTAPAVEKRTTARVFVKEVRGELRKVAWPTRKETLNYSGVVAIALVIMTTLIFGLDWVFSEFVLRLFNVK